MVAISLESFSKLTKKYRFAILKKLWAVANFCYATVSMIVSMELYHLAKILAK